MKEKIMSAIAEIAGIDRVVLTRPDAQFGDYATNVALQLAGKLGKSPRDIATTLADQLSAKLPDVISSIEVAGPGFINIWLTDSALHELAETNPQETLKGQKYVVEYSDPNPFKPLHAGHLYTTLMGDMIARLVEQAGADVVRVNYGGDVGLHVGKSMWAILRELGGENPSALDSIVDKPAWLGARYVEGNNAYEDDEKAHGEIVAVNKRVYQLHAEGDHESPFAQIYWTTRQWSYDYFAELYRQLQVVSFDRFLPESEVTPLGLATVQNQLKAGVYERSGDAVIFDGEKRGLHTRVFINSEGLPTYEAKEVGLILTKWQDYHFDKSVIITANEQEQYMQVVLASIKEFEPQLAERTNHITHGVVKLQGGVKMSSRKGNVLTALELLDAAREAGEASGVSPSEDTILAAVKYAFAKNRIGGDVIYDPKESIALEGNSGPYLQYAHARARSIIGKADSTEEVGGFKLDDAERKLLRKIGEYAETVNLAAAELLPHHICTYLYELAQEFNRFYEHNRVIGDERESVRLDLVTRYADTLKSGLQLLGLSTPDRM